jgi:hypothetical protein
MSSLCVLLECSRRLLVDSFQGVVLSCIYWGFSSVNWESCSSGRTFKKSNRFRWHCSLIIGGMIYPHSSSILYWWLNRLNQPIHSRKQKEIMTNHESKTTKKPRWKRSSRTTTTPYPSVGPESSPPETRRVNSVVQTRWRSIPSGDPYFWRFIASGKR